MKIIKLASILVMALLILTSCQKENILIVHYHQYDQQYDNWTLWTWLDETEIDVNSTGEDVFGLIYKINIDDYPDMGNINILPKFMDWKMKDDPSRSWIRSMPKEIWILEKNAEIFTSVPSVNPSIQRAFLDEENKITLSLTHHVRKSELDALHPQIKINGQRILSGIPTLLNAEDESTLLSIITSQAINLNDFPVRIGMNGFPEKPVELRHILDAEKYISDRPLGVRLENKKTIFTTFAPGAREITLNIYDQPSGGSAKKHNLEAGENGVWDVTIEDKLINTYYTYTIQHWDQTHRSDEEIIDPYARSVTKYNGRGIIVQEDTPIADRPSFPFSDAVIYELHVRDFSISKDSGVKNKGKFLAFTETGTRLAGTDLATGIDHLTDLGVNTVQLLPVQDFEFEETVSDYFWGYMPVNFNAPMNWFSSSRTDGSAVREFKMLVNALHKRGIRVVLDVVYNHTSEGNPQVKYNFNGLIPNFYYRQQPDGSYWNGSGCGNEFRSENPMARRFIVESVKYWVEEYKIDGFRFDLMGLHDMETMKEIVRTLRDIDPNIFIYGEPWTAGDTPIEATVKGTQKNVGFSVFNDNFRDAIKGPWYNTDPGYVQQGLQSDKIKAGIIGSIDDFTAEPYESINYAAVHDGRTLWDQMKASTENDSSVIEEQLEAMHKLAGGIVLTSQGVPFLHGGQDLRRTKFGSHNSYNQPTDINRIRWEWKKDHHNIFSYYQGLIKLRTGHPLFRMRRAENIRNNLRFFDTAPQNCVAYELNRGNSGDEWNKIIVLINPNKQKETFFIPEGRWNVVVDHGQAGVAVISEIENGQVSLEPISIMVAFQ